MTGTVAPWWPLRLPALVIALATACTPSATAVAKREAPEPVVDAPPPQRVVWNWDLSTTANQSLEARPPWSDPGYAPRLSPKLDPRDIDFDSRAWNETRDTTTAVCRVRIPGSAERTTAFTRDHGLSLERDAPSVDRSVFVLPLWDMRPGERMRVGYSVLRPEGPPKEMIGWEGVYEGKLPWKLSPLLQDHDPGACTFLSKEVLRNNLDHRATLVRIDEEQGGPIDGVLPMGHAITVEDTASFLRYGHRRRLLDEIAGLTGWAQPSLQPLAENFTDALERVAQLVPARFEQAWADAGPAVQAGLERVDCDPTRIWGPDDPLGAVLQLVVTLGLSSPNRAVPGRCVLIFDEEARLGNLAFVLDRRRSRYLTARTLADASKFGRKGKATVAVADFAHDERETQPRLLWIDGKFYRLPEIDFSRSAVPARP